MSPWGLTDALVYAEWHFLLEGPPETPYAGGWYIGRLRFPVSMAAANLER